MKNNSYLHTHPIEIYFNLYRFLYLLLIPLARGAISALSGGLWRWLSGAWADLLIIGLMILLAYAKWRNYEYYGDNNFIYYKTGIFIQQQAAIPMHHICTMALEQPFWMRPFRIVRLHIDTLAQKPDRTDLSFYLHKEDAQTLLRLHHPTESPETCTAIVRPRHLDVVFLSLFTSNSFIGIVFVATFISQAGKLLGNDLYTFLNELLRQLAIGLEPITALITFAFSLPPIATGLAAVLFGGWLIAFLLTLFQTTNLAAARSPNYLHITGGILVKNEYSLQISQLTYIDIRQSLLTRVFHLYSVFLNAVGLGKNRTDIRSLIPFSAQTRCIQHLALLLPEYQVTSRTIKPNRGAIMKFILEPMWPCVLVPLATWAGITFLPAWSSIVGFVGLMVSVACYWFLGVRIMDYVSSGISCCNDYYTLRYSKSYYLHTVVFPGKNIALINMRQSILQRTDAKCDVKISTRAERAETHHIRNLSWDETAKLFDAEDGFRMPPSAWDRLVAFFYKVFPFAIKK